MNYIVAFLYKELIELKISYKKILSISWLIIIPLVSLYDSEYSFISKESIVPFLILIVAFSISGQLSSNSIISEKKSKTLDIILCDNIPKYSIVFGKIIPPFIIGFIASVISYCILFIVSRYISSDLNITFNISLILTQVIVAYLASSLSILTNLLVNDERFVPVTSFFIAGVIGYLIYKLDIYNIIFNLLLVIFSSIIINILSILILKKSSSLLLKL